MEVVAAMSERMSLPERLLVDRSLSKSAKRHGVAYVRSVSRPPRL